MTSPNSNIADRDRGQGQRLRAAREAAGLGLEDVARQLHMPVRIVEALEAEDWTRIGAPVFVRGQLRSYARLLKLPVEPIQNASGAAPIEPTQLVSRAHTPRMQRVADQLGSRLVYIVITALIVVPVWMATRSHLDVAETAVSLDATTQAPAEAASAHSPQASAKQPAATAPSNEPSTVIASLGALPPRHAEPQLTLRFSGDSWVRIVGPDGGIVEEALLRAGEERSYPAAAVGRVVLGNAGAVEVRRDGEAQDLAPFMRASVARFAVSSDGSLAPSAE